MRFLGPYYLILLYHYKKFQDSRRYMKWTMFIITNHKLVAHQNRRHNRSIHRIPTTFEYTVSDQRNGTDIGNMPYDCVDMNPKIKVKLC